MCPNMKRLFAYITLPLLLVAAAASAQEVETVSPLDSVQLGNLFQLKAGGALSAGGCLFEKSPEVDIAVWAVLRPAGEEQLQHL